MASEVNMERLFASLSEQLSEQHNANISITKADDENKEMKTA